MNDQLNPDDTSHLIPEVSEKDGEFKPSERFGAALNDAETLLKFAATEGRVIPEDVVSPIVTARMKYGHSGFEKSELMAFFSSLTVLSSLLRPVTANSIRACEAEETKQKLRRDRNSAIIWTIVTLLMSANAFVNHSFSARIGEDITAANQLAVALREGIGPNVADGINSCRARQSASDKPMTLDGDKLTRLQGFAALAREVYKQSLKFSTFVPRFETDPLDAQERSDLEINPAVLNYQAEVVCKISLYEKVRDFARNVALDNGYVWGAISQYLLPVLYSIVGAYAFRLRSFSETVRSYTYHPSFADSARMIGAFIVGSVISLFNLSTEGFSLSPLAIAFLAGYAVEVFFAVLDALVQTVGRRDGSVSTKSSVTIVHGQSSSVSAGAKATGHAVNE